MNSITLLPAIRSQVGDWITYVTTMSFEEIERLVKAPDEVHERRNLSDWIQREAIDKHAEDIANYINSTQQRFLGALIVGVYGGSPDWAPLKIDLSIGQWEVDALQEDKICGKLGLLKLSGTENLFAIDGQHRVAGIKRYIQKLGNNALKNDELSAIFVAHDPNSQEGKKRTRRLFTTVNKKAKRISKSAKIALDEDDGFAVITRQIIDEHWLFEDNRKHISYRSEGSLSSADTNAITSVVGLYEIIKDLYPRSRSEFEKNRPDEVSLAEFFERVTEFIDTLIEKCSEFTACFVDRENNAKYYREEKNHLLFRPAGQRAFAKAVQLLMKRQLSLQNAVCSLLDVDLDLASGEWDFILWDPINQTMIAKNIVLAETQLLRLAGHEPRNRKNAERLNAIINSRSSE